jgi:signal transduction histidine kinase
LSAPTLSLLTAPAWRRALPVARVVLALICLAPNPIFGSIYLAIAAGLLFWRMPARPPYLLGTLIIDAVFLILAAFLVEIPELGLFGPLWILFLMTTAILLYDWRVILVLASCILALSIVRKPPEFEPLLVSTATLSGLALVGVWQRARMEKRIYQLSRQSVMARAEAEQGKANERERIAEDFHDGPLQGTISFQVRLEVLRRMLLKDPAKGLVELEQMQGIWKNQVGEMRAFVHSIRLAAEVPGDLNAALRNICETFRKDSGLDVSYEGNVEADLEPEKAVQVLHLTREALHNVRKHAEASAAKVKVENEEDHVSLMITDDGRGFPFAGSLGMDELEKQHIGPSSIKRRVRLLEGDMQIDSAPGNGSRLQVRFPK